VKRTLILIVLLLSALSNAQEKRYFDTPFGGGGGYTPAWYIHNLDAVNDQLRLNNIPEIGESGVFSSGGGGFIYIGFIQNLRLGGMGFGGTTSSDASIAGVQKEARYTFGGGGITVEYTLPFIKQIGVSVGTVLGAAYQKIEVYKNSGAFGWGNIWNGFTGSDMVTDYSRVMENNYWLLSPTFNIDIPFYRFFIFRIGAGYNFSLGNEWTIENDKDLAGVPSDLNGDGFFIQSGIFVGFFSF